MLLLSILILMLLLTNLWVKIGSVIAEILLLLFFVVVAAVVGNVAVVIVVDPRNLYLKFNQNQVSTIRCCWCYCCCWLCCCCWWWCCCCCCLTQKLTFVGGIIFVSNPIYVFVWLRLVVVELGLWQKWKRSFGMIWTYI